MTTTNQDAQPNEDDKPVAAPRVSRLARALRNGTVTSAAPTEMPTMDAEPMAAEVMPSTITLESAVMVYEKPQRADERVGSSINLATAEAYLMESLRSGEQGKIKMARVVQSIRDRKLYLEAGVPTMKAYYPLLFDKTARVGWNSERIVKNYLTLADVYLDELAYDPEDVLGAISHLLMLLRLADIDRTSGGLKNDVKDDKLNGVEFDDICKLVMWLVNEGGTTRRDESVTAQLLDRADLTTAATVYANLMQRAVTIPTGGWGVADTKAIVDRVTKKAEEPVYTRVWVLEREEADYVWISNLSLLLDGTLVDVVSFAGKHMTRKNFSALAGKDKAILAENAGDDSKDGFTTEADDDMDFDRGGEDEE